MDRSTTLAFWVYILRCADGLYYVGSHRGESVATRVSEHNSGKYPDAWTRERRPVALAWSCEFQRVTDAVAFERRLKRWSRAKKEAVIEGRWDDLPELARSRGRDASTSSA